MKIKKSNIIILMLVLFMFAGLTGGDLTITIGNTDVADFPKICVPISVQDASGNTITGLTKELVSVYEDTVLNSSVEIETLRERGENIAILLAVDASLSMRGEPIDSVKAAIKSLAEHLRDGDKLGIISFHDRIDVISTFINNKDSLVAFSNNIQAIGRITELYYGVDKGLDMLHDASDIPATRILIVLSDGKDEGEAYTFDDCVSKAKRFGIPVYSIGYHTSVGIQYRRILERMSDKTGGIYNDAPTVNELANLYVQTFEQIQERTILCFNANVFIADSLEHTRSVSVAKDNDSGNANFRFRSPAAIATGPIEAEINWWVLGTIAAVIILLIVLLILRRQKKNREKEARLEEEKQRQIAEQERLEKEQTNVEAAANDEKPVIKKTEVVHAPVDPRKTVIMGREPISAGLQLTFETGPLTGQTKTILTETSIGRASDNNIVINEATVSGHHCKIMVVGNNYVVEDLNSTNGTKVNGSGIAQAPLSSGSLLQLGAIKISVQG